MSAYRLSDPKITEALVEAPQRGVAVHLLIEPAPFSHEKTANVSSPSEKLEKAGIKLHYFIQAL